MHMNKNDLKWLWYITKSQHTKMYILALGDICVSILGVVFALLTRNLIDSIANNTAFFSLSAVFLILTVLLQYCIRAAINFLDESVTTKVSNQLRSYIINNLIHKDYASFKKLHSGDWINRMFSDVQIISAGFTRIIPSAIGMSVRLIAACIALLFLTPLFAVIYLTIGIIMIFVISILRKKVKKLHYDAQKKEDKVHSLFQELTEKMLTIKIFNANDYVSKKTINYQDAYRAAKLKRQAYVVTANSSFALTFRLGYVLALIYGGKNLQFGLTTYGTIMAVLQLINQIQAPVAQLSGVLTRVYEVTASTERIREAEEQTSFLEITNNHVNFHSVQFQNVTFAYDQEMVLDDISFEVSKGDAVAITGMSGGGKSTLFLLMMGIYSPKKGTVNIYDESSLLPDENRSSLFAYVPQENSLLSGTIAENVALNYIYDEEKIQNALRIAAALEFVENLPDGIHTVLGENGSGLSEGQIQRLKIARAVYSERPILLLDEATSALDEKTETVVLENLKNLKDKTILIVTHRKAALSICNRYLCIENGKIEE